MNAQYESRRVLFKVFAAAAAISVSAFCFTSCNDLDKVTSTQDSDSSRTVTSYDTSLSGYYFIRNAYSNLYLDVENGGTDNGTNIQQYEYNGCTAQQFNLVYVGSGYYAIKTVCSDSAKALDVWSKGTSDGTNISTYTYSGGSNQLFKFVKQSDGSYAILTKITSDASCLDDYGWSTSNGGNVVQWNYWGGACQYWYLTAVSSSSDIYGTRSDSEESISYTTGSSYVATKYSSGTTDARSSQSSWKATNCHDPKLFQDDDGTYYVYSTDASVGNAEHTGIVVRSSTDLVNWTTHDHSALYGYWDPDFVYWEGFVASSDPDTVHNDSSFTAVSWAPTVIKQNGLYYMYHGVNNDSGVSTGASSAIVLAIASSAKGPFYPASYISGYAGSNTDILSIQNTLSSLGVTYSQNFLVRYVKKASSASVSTTPSINGTAVDSVDFTQSDNGRFGAIDPEFVYDIATGSLMTYSINGNTCYAMTYGSWMSGISVIYVDSTSLKPVYYDYAGNSKSSITVDGTTYTSGSELNCSLGQANYEYYGEAYKGNYGCLGVRIAGGYGAGYEGSQLIYNSSTGYYYIFVSMGPLSYDYRVGVGRSSSLTGTYYDAGGKSMLLSSSSSATNYYGNYKAIGSKIIGAFVFDDEYSFRCQGGQSILRTSDGKIIFANHTRTNFQEGYYFYLQCHEMFFNGNGWPVLNLNEYYNDYDGSDEGLTALTMSSIAGTYDAVLTVRGTTTGSYTVYGETISSTTLADAAPTESVTMTIASDGTISGNYTGTFTLGSDGYSISIKLKDSSGNSLGTFKGFVMNATDWARGESVSSCQTIHITSLCSDSSATEGGEYFFANKQ